MCGEVGGKNVEGEVWWAGGGREEVRAGGEVEVGSSEVGGGMGVGGMGYDAVFMGRGRTGWG